MYNAELESEQQPSALSHHPIIPLTLKQYNGEVLCGLTLAGGKALICPWVSFLGCRDEQSLIVGTLDGEVLVRNDGFCVAKPGDGEVGRALNGTGQNHCAADACFQVLGG